MYTIKEASARSGIGIPLLRAWERRYGVVSPMRTPSGYRLYDEEAIERLAAMRRLIAAGWAAQQAAERVRESDRASLAVIADDGRAPAPASEPPPEAEIPSTAAQVVEQLVGAARQLDAPAIEAALDDIFGAARFEAASDTVLMPALRAIGDAWARGDLSVAGEHVASQAVLRRLAMAYEAAGAPGASRPVLVGLGPGARHELGAVAFATAARRAGLPVLYLGPDLPAESWTSAAVGRDARAAVLGVPTRADVARARDVLSELRLARPEMLLAVGGAQARQAARDDAALELPQGLADSVRDLRTELERHAERQQR
jgi:DNA-binding transcriptional MerR regulator/methylmalonyl-CoA mutase cobalamin-binding subunit